VQNAAALCALEALQLHGTMPKSEREADLAYHELCCVCCSGVGFQHAVHYALTQEQQQRLLMQLDGQQQRRDDSRAGEQVLQWCSPARKHLCKEVPPHANVGCGIWALHASNTPLKVDDKAFGGATAHLTVNMYP